MFSSKCQNLKMSVWGCIHSVSSCHLLKLKLANTIFLDLDMYGCMYGYVWYQMPSKKLSGFTFCLIMLLSDCIIFYILSSSFEGCSDWRFYYDEGERNLNVLAHSEQNQLNCKIYNPQWIKLTKHFLCRNMCTVYSPYSVRSFFLLVLWSHPLTTLVCAPFFTNMCISCVRIKGPQGTDVSLHHSLHISISKITLFSLGFRFCTSMFRTK